MSKLRDDFENVLVQLMNKELSSQDWHHWIVNHYHDNVVEEIRCEVVRLAIADTLYTDLGREKLARWHDDLLNKPDKSD